ncbi:MAG: outer membrane protein assembly factor BamE [Rhodanobacteraceae bacterium]|nr:outer membrane protein assembly factor BamE [Xanthomonadales bacterium]MCP5478385.1 outer membrane protein assembly factor BamE [Rhodanobacteraceae bacterium]HPF74187.1 outer membrane protein assembly factor BamE [Xanthomonadaceae bacterium]HRX99311.1 outer membrane protein assembly factor BamE [Xanthomonadaceae bacterium]
MPQLLKFTLKPALKLATAALLASTVVGCGLIYKVPVYQGNLLEPAKVEQLKPGLSKRQVSLLLGTPSIRDPFHQERWDYTASFKRDGGKTEVKTLTLTFDGDSLATIDGDYFKDEPGDLAKEMGRYGNLPREKDKGR